MRRPEGRPTFCATSRSPLLLSAGGRPARGEVVLHLAQTVLHVPQVASHLMHAFLPLVRVGTLLWLSLTITTPRHETSSLPESTLDERVDARDVPDEVLRDAVTAGEVGSGIVAYQYIAVAVAPDQDLQWQV